MYSISRLLYIIHNIYYNIIYIFFFGFYFIYYLGADEGDEVDNYSDDDMPSKKRLKKYTRKILNVTNYLLLFLKNIFGNYVSAGGKGIHRSLANSRKEKINKQMKTSKPHESQGSKKKNNGKKSNGNIQPFSYTAFNNYSISNKNKRKRK